MRAGSFPRLWRCAAGSWLAIVGGTAATRAADPPGLVGEPLAAHSGPRGATLFKVMSPAETGVVTENAYADPKMWADHYQEFVYGATGCGIAVGDYDNDGRPDLFVVSKTGQCRLFRNLGHWKFEDVTEKAGLLEGAGNNGWLDQAKRWIGESGGGVNAEAWKQGATFVDVNNDGWLDIYVCRFNAPNLLYINQHDGTFKEEAAARGLAVVDCSGMASFCDYDRDGWLDVYIQTNMLDAAKHPNGQRDYLFHNNGDGTFTNVTDRAGISGETCGHSATWWDYDGDGWPDLYVANDYGVPDQLYHNDRNGTFTNVAARVLPHTPYYAMGSDIGDVNNDGRMDFMVADMAASTHEKDQRGMAGSRERAQLNPDAGPAAPQYMHSALYLNTGLGRMQEAAYLAGVAATDWTWSVRFEDLDNDGRLDLYFTNGMVREFHNADLLTRIMSAETIPDSWRMVRATPVMKERHLAFRNLGDLQFQDVSAAWGLDQVAVSFGAAFADFDGDGDLDLVYANYGAGVTMLRNDSDQGHRLVIALRGTRSNRFGIGSTVRIETASGIQMRTLDLARGYMSSSEPIVHFGLGDDAVVKRLTVEWPSGAEQTFTNVTADRKLTITEPKDSGAAPLLPGPGRGGKGRRESTPREAQFSDVSSALNLAQPTREAGDDDPGLQPLIPMRFNHRGPALAVADIDADGREDLLLGGTSSDPERILVRGADGRYTAFSRPPVASAAPDGPVLVFDANGDGHADVLLTHGGNLLPAGAREYQPRLLVNDGHGALQPAADDALPAFPVSVGALAAADFDRDGRLDVFVGGRVEPGAYPSAPRSALWRNRGGRFEDVTDTVAPALRNVGMVSSALWTDVDGDGWPDLLVALEWGPVRYFHNDRGQRFSDWTDRAGFGSGGSGWWTSIASADFNGDGRPDYVVGNVGLNTPYRATAKRPTLIYRGDFARSGAPLLVEACYEGDRLYPRRTRNVLGAKIPAILQRFRRNDPYAHATLDEVVGQSALDSAQRFAATELRSGVFLSRPDGTYRFQPLPRIAQIAPLQGIVAGDFDGDGHADIYAVQNSYAPIQSTGHFDGGVSQFLRGDGRGHFTAVEPAVSGLMVPGDAKALVVVDLDDDGWPDFVLTRNNSTTMAYRNRGVAGRHSLRVGLRGSKGNPTAIGARLTLELTDGAAEFGEVAAGSGYYSQSAPYCFFGYPDGNPPRRISVRWPDGATTEHTVAQGTTNITLSAGKER